jgi:hypothetical protein
VALSETEDEDDGEGGASNRTVEQDGDGEFNGNVDDDEDEDENVFMDRLDERIREVVAYSTYMQDATAALDAGQMIPRPVPGAIAIGSGSGGAGVDGDTSNQGLMAFTGMVSMHDATGTKRKDHSESEDDTTKTKRRARRDNRQTARNVIILPRDENGNLLLPCAIGKGSHEVVILRLGQVIPDRDGYHSSRYVFPLGYTSRKEYPSPVVPGKKTYWTSTILDSPNGPVVSINFFFLFAFATLRERRSITNANSQSPLTVSSNTRRCTFISIYRKHYNFCLERCS